MVEIVWLLSWSLLWNKQMQQWSNWALTAESVFKEIYIYSWIIESYGFSLDTPYHTITSLTTCWHRKLQANKLATSLTLFDSVWTANTPWLLYSSLSFSWCLVASSLAVKFLGDGARDWIPSRLLENEIMIPDFWTAHFLWQLCWTLYMTTV